MQYFIPMFQCLTEYWKVIKQRQALLWNEETFHYLYQNDAAELRNNFQDSNWIDIVESWDHLDILTCVGPTNLWATKLLNFLWKIESFRRTIFGGVGFLDITVKANYPWEKQTWFMSPFNRKKEKQHKRDVLLLLVIPKLCEILFWITAFEKQPLELLYRERCSHKILQISQENSCVGISFEEHLQTTALSFVNKKRCTIR